MASIIRMLFLPIPKFLIKAAVADDFRYLPGINRLNTVQTGDCTRDIPDMVASVGGKSDAVKGVLHHLWWQNREQFHSLYGQNELVCKIVRSKA